MGTAKWYINTTNGNKVKINIEYLPLSIAKTLKEVEPVAEKDIPEVLKEVPEIKHRKRR